MAQERKREARSQRNERLAKALRENLTKRKEQQRKRLKSSGENPPPEEEERRGR
jgi:hypothetical protein